MLFNSLSFAVFFPIVTIIYFLLPGAYRWVWLLAASCYFYAYAVPAYLLVLTFLVLVDYGAARAIAATTRPASRTIYLALSLITNLGLLCFFKYLSFFSFNLSRVLGFGHTLYPGLALPIGLSFHTFQSIAYTVEVYRGRAPAERNLGIYALFVMFYPQLVAGPIERPQNLIPQLRAQPSFDYVRAVRGVQLMAWGGFKKMVIANRLNSFPFEVYSRPTSFQGPDLVLATLAFSFQIYCDFSGYTDIARGAAEVLGIQLMRNFDRPYWALSIGDFWSRWHISLSSWFRDYLYVPLGGNRVGAGRRYFNILLVFLLSGLWHGARWTFLAWGFVHALMLIGEKLCNWKTPSSRPGRACARMATFLLVTLAWIPFRAESVPVTWTIFSRLGTGWGHLPAWEQYGTVLPEDWWFAAFSILLLMAVEYGQSRGIAWRSRLAAQSGWVRWLVYYAGLGGTLVLTKSNDLPFLYFQF